MMSIRQDEQMIVVGGARYEQFYQDGAPDGPINDPKRLGEARAAERAFRDGFLAMARVAVSRCHCPSELEMKAAHMARSAVRLAWSAYIPSADYFGITDTQKRAAMDSQQIAYRPGHRVEAARFRGIHHALVYVEEGWKTLEADGARSGLIGQFVMPLWLAAVERWAADWIEPPHYRCAPRVADDLTAAQRQALRPANAA